MRPAGTMMRDGRWKSSLADPKNGGSSESPAGSSTVLSSKQAYLLPEAASEEIHLRWRRAPRAV